LAVKQSKHESRPKNEWLDFELLDISIGIKSRHFISKCCVQVSDGTWIRTRMIADKMTSLWRGSPAASCVAQERYDDTRFATSLRPD